VGRTKDNELFPTHVQIGWKGCIDYSKLKVITRKDHFPPLFIDPLVEHLAGHLYYSYYSYNHVPLGPDKQENTTLTFAFGVFAYYHMSFGSCNAPIVKSLAEDCKLSACGRQPFITLSFLLSFDLVFFVLLLFSLCFLGNVFAIQVWGSVLLHYTGLAHPIQYCISGHIGDNVSF
jgi:hypothetical protein